MPKHALAPTREKPAATPSVVCSASTTSTPAVLSNEVLLRSKIAQLQLEKVKQQQQQQQRKGKNKSKSAVASSEAGGQHPTTGASSSSSSSSSSSASATRVSGSGGGRSGRPARKAPSAVSKHQLAGDEAGEKDSTPTAVNGVGVGRAQTGGRLGSGLPEAEKDVMRRFEAQVALVHEQEGTENCLAKEGSSEETGQQQQQQQLWHGFTAKGVQALREMYLDQVRTARSMNKHAGLLTRKTQEIEKSNEVMRTEAEACAQKAARLDQAAAKLHALSVELETQRAALVKTRGVEAAEETATREKMNASLNDVVSDISKKIKEQEEERLAQDAENISLRSDLQTLLQNYDDHKNSSEAALRAHEEEGGKLAKRLEILTAAAQKTLEGEEALTKAIGELTEGEGKLRQRVGEHANRLQRQEAGLKTYLESVQRLQAEETALLVSIARLSKQKTALLSRAGCAAACDGAVETGGGGGGGGGDGDEVLGGGTVGEKDEGEGLEGFAGEAEMRTLLLAKKQSAAEMETEKDRLQARCRELQAERKMIMAEAEPLAATASEKEEGEEEGARSSTATDGTVEVSSEV